MRVIQNELGDRVKRDTEIEEIKKKILAAKMPKSMEEKALSELNRYASLSNTSGESAIIKTYLDFVISCLGLKNPRKPMTLSRQKNSLTRITTALKSSRKGYLNTLP